MTLFTQFRKLIFENMQRNCWQYILQNLEAKADYKLVTRISTHKAWHWKESLHKVTKDMVDLPAHKALKFICFQPQQFVQFRTWPHQPFSPAEKIGRDCTAKDKTIRFGSMLTSAESFLHPEEAQNSL